METNWSNEDQCKKVAATSRRSNVATFPRRNVSNVATLGQPIQSQQFKTSRRLNVATLQRRDVSSRSVPHHLKYEGLRNQRGDREAYVRGHEILEQSDTDFEEVPGICTVSQFLDIRMMFLILNIFIFSFSMF